MNFEKEIEGMIKRGIYCQHEIFNRLYPYYEGHYAGLRTLISRIKSNDANRFR